MLNIKHRLMHSRPKLFKFYICLEDWIVLIGFDRLVLWRSVGFRWRMYWCSWVTEKDYNFTLPYGSVREL